MAVEIAVSVLAKIAEYLVLPCGRQFGYLFCYNRNIKNLKSEAEKLNNWKEGVQGEVDADIRNLENIRPEVDDWLKRVDKNKADAMKIIEDNEKVRKGCLNGWCPNIKSRYSLSKKALKKTQNLGELIAEGKFEKVANPPTPVGIIPTAPAAVETPVDVKFRGDGIQEASEAAPVIDLEIPSTSKGSFGGFESRSWIMRDVMKALKDDKVRIIGIWGMGGVGKTTMAKEVVKRVRKEGICDEVGMVVVSQQPDLKKVQGDIAEWLGLRLEEQDLSARAVRLHQRLTQKGPNGTPKKIILILDDIWTRLDLEEVGIHYVNDHNSCKILLTSREKDVCDQMRTDKIYRIEVLAKEEAWNLFQETVRIPLDATTDLFPIAEDIVKECGGLPLAITTIATVLANKKELAWNYVLRQLKNSDYPVVYSTLQLSYDFLEIEEIKYCFRLCCLFPEDFDIPIEDLVRYGIGQKRFRNINKLHVARENAHVHVDTLRNSNLLLGSAIVDCVKMHDLVRDFALSIASKGQFLVKFGNEIKEWPSEDTYEHYTSISLQCDKMDELPDGLECPNLKLLRLVGLDHDSLKFPERFFEGMRKLQVLVLRRMSIPSLPVSLQFLTNLRTLSLNRCRLEGYVSMIGKLEALEILSFAHSEIQDLPIEIGKLSRLRLLDLTGSSKLHRLPSGLLSSLRHLEELYLRGTSIRWAKEIQANPSIYSGGGGEVNASFAELKVLSNLVVLEIDIPYEVLPLVDLIFLEKLEKFYVCFGGTLEKEMMHAFQNTLCCIVDTSVILEGVLHVLCKKTEVLYLEVKDLKNLQKELEREELLKVRDLELVSCDEMVSLVNTVGRQTTNAFRNLESLCLRDMRKLKSIFSLSIARGLINLKRLKVVGCQAMEELFTKERGGEDKEAAGTFEFPHLESLHLKDLPSLVGFCKAVDEIELPQLEVMELRRLPKITSIYSKTEDLAAERQNASSEHSFFNGKVKLNNMARLQLFGMENLTEIWIAHNLRELSVENCGRLVNISLSAIARGLVMLERLDIFGCEMMDAIFWKERGEDEVAATAVAKIQFPHLKEVELPQLESVQLLRLPKLDGLASKGHLFNTKGLQNLLELKVNKCESVEVVFDLQRSNVNEGGHELAALSTQLQRVTLGGLDNLRHVWKKGPHVIQGSSFQNLSYLDISWCGSLRHVFTPSIAKILVGLQEVSIHYCKNLEAIVAKEEEGEEEEEGGGMMLFPQLTTLSLRHLPKLLNMTPKPCTINYRSSLKKLTLDKCGKLIETMNDTLEGLQNLRELSVRNSESVEVVFDLQRSNVNEGGHDLAALSTQLQSVELWDLDNLRHVWKKGPHVIQGSFFQNLSYLHVYQCGSLRHVFTPSIAKVLVGLQTVRIYNCKNLEAIVAKEEEEEEGGGMMLFPQLTTLSLGDLPKLLNMTPKPYTFNWSSLKELNWGKCDKLIETMNDTLEVTSNNMETQQVRELHNLTVSFPTSVLLQLRHLEKLNIWRCSSLEVIFDLQGLNVIQLAGAFQYLSSLTVEVCDSLRHVFTPPIAKLLSRLQTLKIHNCKNLEAIVEKEEEEEDVVEGGEIFILFPQLTSLSLEKLPKLLKITPKAYTFNCPSLTLVDCGKLTETLYDTLQITSNNMETQQVRELHNLTVSFPTSVLLQLQHLEKLHIQSCSSLEVLFDLQGLNVIQLAGAFQYLSSLTVKGCDSLRHVFTTPIAKLLSRLQTLKIYNCENLEAIVAKEEEEEKEYIGEGGAGGGIFILFPQLTSLSLERLPKLLNITLQGSFKNLSSLEVQHCDSLKHAFTLSMAKLLLGLKKLKIVECENLEAIVAEEDEEEEKEGRLELGGGGGINVILFPQLTSLYLEGLRNVLTIMPKPYTFNRSSLEVIDCDKLQDIQ